VVNSYVRNARALAAGDIDQEVPVEVVELLCETTLDGLSKDMQTTLSALLAAERITGKGDVIHKAGVASLATACECDVASIESHVEPYLIRQGLLIIAPGGRALTAAGVGARKVCRRREPTVQRR
jgi:Holliday junction resolvasome RuvABC ATP-dependent DNA helicase subunit